MHDDELVHDCIIARELAGTTNGSATRLPQAENQTLPALRFLPAVDGWETCSLTRCDGDALAVVDISDGNGPPRTRQSLGYARGHGPARGCQSSSDTKGFFERRVVST
jgi:hypothetical protein